MSTIIPAQPGWSVTVVEANIFCPDEVYVFTWPVIAWDAEPGDTKPITPWSRVDLRGSDIEDNRSCWVREYALEGPGINGIIDWNTELFEDRPAYIRHAREQTAREARELARQRAKAA
jgi:hypothetical protein